MKRRGDLHWRSIRTFMVEYIVPVGVLVVPSLYTRAVIEGHHPTRGEA